LRFLETTAHTHLNEDNAKKRKEFDCKKTLKEVWEKQMKDREAYNTTDQIFQ